MTEAIQQCIARRGETAAETDGRVTAYSSKGEKQWNISMKSTGKCRVYQATYHQPAPKIAVVLGSGLGNLTADFTETEELPYKDIPNFPVSTVAGHKGALLAGKLGEKESMRWKDGSTFMKATL